MSAPRRPRGHGRSPSLAGTLATAVLLAHGPLAPVRADDRGTAGTRVPVNPDGSLMDLPTPPAPRARTPASAARPEAEAVDRVEPPAGREAEYERRFVGWQRRVVYDGVRQSGDRYTGEVRGAWGAPYLGADEAPLEGEALYLALDRPDLAARHRQRRKLRVALAGAGGGVAAAGVLTAILGGLAGTIHPTCWEQDPLGRCLLADASPNGPALAVGVSVSLVGVGLLIAGAAVPSAPVSTAAAHRLALEHNQRLRASLGLPPRAEPRCPDDRDRPPTLDPRTTPPPPPPPPPPPLLNPLLPPL